MAGYARESQPELVRLVAELLDELEGTAVTECVFRAGDRRVRVLRSLVSPPAMLETAMAPIDGVPETWRPVMSPLTGIFYLTDTPQGPPLVSVGSVVAERQVVGLIESMKMYNPVETDVAGIVRAIEAQPSAVVEEGQILMYVEPAGDSA